MWKDTTAKVKEQQLDDEEYQQLQLGDPVEGKHRCSQHAVMYKDIHAFMKNRKWAPTDAGSHVGGVTWLELFIIFDITGARSHNGDHVKDKEAAKRAEARSAKVKKTNRGKETQNAIVKPKLGEELARFKAIVRHIAKHEVKGTQADYFLMEKRQHLTRLAGLAVYGHQPAIAGFLQISSHEKEDMIKAILMQKVGSNPKTIKSHVDLRSRQQQAGDERATIRMKIARIATGVTIRWKREKNSNVQEEVDPSKYQGPQYRSRMIACNHCGEKQETKSMQLRTIEGFRAIHCRRCGAQERCIKNECTCGQVWHRCNLHGVDPHVHQSRRGVQKVNYKRKGEGKESKEEMRSEGLSSTRKAPITKQGKFARERKTKVMRSHHWKKKNRDDDKKHARFPAASNPPQQDMINRIRAKCRQSQPAKTMPEPEPPMRPMRKSEDTQIDNTKVQVDCTHQGRRRDECDGKRNSRKHFIETTCLRIREEQAHKAWNLKNSVGEKVVKQGGHPQGGEHDRHCLRKSLLEISTANAVTKRLVKARR